MLARLLGGDELEFGFVFTRSRASQMALDPATGLKRPGTKIALPWHVGLHAICCTSLISLAAAWACRDAEASVSPDPRLPSLAWEVAASRWRVNLCGA